ncbi:MAG: nuclear transport factor 2 family protein [Gammaproteobacteria bacterium]
MKTHAAFAATLSAVLLMTSVAGTTRAADAAGSDLTLKATMQRLVDREAIVELLVTYARLLDKKDLPGYSRLFAADGVWEGGIGSAKGPAEIQQMLERVYGRAGADKFGSGAYHIMSDFIVDIDRDVATSWSRWTWIVEGRDGKPAIERSGHYEDKLVRVAGQWRFKHRLTVTEMPTPQKDTEARIFRRDHREKD